MTAWSSGAIASAPNSPLSIGAHVRNDGSLGRYTRMLLAEVLVYNRTFSIPEREFVEGHLANKWGMTDALPASGIRPLGLFLSFCWGGLL